MEAITTLNGSVTGLDNYGPSIGGTGKWPGRAAAPP